MVVFIYGSMLWYIFPVKDDISWEGHLAGFLTGLLMAIFVKAKVPSVKKYAWESPDYNEEDDEFLRHFDEDGNFIENRAEQSTNDSNSVRITYHYKKGSKGDGNE